MINESYYWKKELYNYFLIIAKFRLLKKPSKQSYVNLEKAILMGAYVVRKLNEANKIPPSFLQKQEQIECYVSNGTSIDFLNWHKIEKHYQLNQKISTTWKWQSIINQIIHSFSLIVSYDDANKLDAILINSDKSKIDGLYIIPIKTLLSIFLSISEGDLTAMKSIRDLKNGELKLKDGTYSYPNKLNISTAVENTLNGNVYIRPSELIWYDNILTDEEFEQLITHPTHQS